MIIKICGITTLDDALAAVEAGADMLGFNFYPPSPRYVERTTCIRLVNAIRNRGLAVTMVGVFVNTPPAEVGRILAECGLDLAQLSGDEPTRFGQKSTILNIRSGRPMSIMMLRPAIMMLMTVMTSPILATGEKLLSFNKRIAAATAMPPWARPTKNTNCAMYTPQAAPTGVLIDVTPSPSVSCIYHAYRNQPTNRAKRRPSR